MTRHTKVRRGVFETNSSSTHSISIASGAETLDTIPVDDDGVCRVQPGEFGWEEETFHDAATKASYAMEWALNYGNRTHLDMLAAVIKDRTGAREVVFGDWDGRHH